MLGEDFVKRRAVLVRNPSVGGHFDHESVRAFRPRKPFLRGHGRTLPQNPAETVHIVQRQIPTGAFFLQIAEGRIIGDQRGTALTQCFGDHVAEVFSMRRQEEQVVRPHDFCDVGMCDVAMIRR